MGKLKEAMLVKEETARLAALKLQAKVDAKAAREADKAKRAAEKAAKAEEMRIRAERRKNAQSEAELVALGREFGYENPEYWAKHVWNGRRKGGYR